MLQTQNMAQFLSPLLMSQAMPFIPDRDLFINVTRPGRRGPQGPQGPPGTPGLVPVTIVTSTPFTPTLSEYFLASNVSATSSIILPVAPIGTVFIVKDASGNASTNPITITAVLATIDGVLSYTLNSDYASITFTRTSLEWSIT